MAKKKKKIEEVKKDSMGRKRLKLLSKTSSMLMTIQSTIQSMGLRTKMSYRKKLKVAYPDGKPIFATINNHSGIVNIKVDKIESMKDKEFPNGIIRMRVNRKRYQEAIQAITQYIEGLLLKQMGDEENENRNPSNVVAFDLGRDSKAGTKRKTRKPKGEGTSASVHSSTGGDNETEGDRERASASEVVESNDPQSS